LLSRKPIKLRSRHTHFQPWFGEARQSLWFWVNILLLLESILTAATTILGASYSPLSKLITILAIQVLLIPIYAILKVFEFKDRNIEEMFVRIVT
jgi:heme/copper-type cytochrome/quinol oxidase subunit 3